MAKYTSKGVRVIAVNEKYIIPGGEAVELTDNEVKLPQIAVAIDSGELFKTKETVVEPNVSVDEMTVKQLQEYAASQNIDLGKVTAKDDILAAIKAAETK
jgi:hypothetical protein